jgi:glycine/D-amino acid oxidase-like deaminating enzyme
MIRAPLKPSLWYATAAPAPDLGPLQETIEADVAVVGAGYTGLSTALHLAEQGVRVAVVEAEQAGYGCSGRNAGHCTPTFHFYSIPKVRRMVGEPYAERLVQRQTNAANLVGELVRRYSIDCEWRQTGYLHAAHTPSALAKLEQHNETYLAIGKATRVLDREQTVRLTGTSRFFGAWFHPDGGHLNPLGYSRGLARAVLGLGGRIFTGSRVTAIEPVGSRWAVVTARGRALADKVVCGTGAYTDGYWRGLDKSFAIQPVFVAATQPLSDNVRKSILPDNNTVHDGRGDLFCYKYNKEGRIVASMFPAGRRGPDPAYTRQVMTDRLRWLYPQLDKVEWEYLWWGDIDVQPRTIPRLFELAPGVMASLGYSGRGVPTGTMMGTVLADWARGVPVRDLALKPEPLAAAPAYMKVMPRLMLSYFRWRDNRAARRDGTELPPHAA